MGTGRTRAIGTYSCGREGELTGAFRRPCIGRTLHGTSVRIEGTRRPRTAGRRQSTLARLATGVAWLPREHDAGFGWLAFSTRLTT